MSAAAASVWVAIVGVTSAIVGPIVVAFRSRRKDSIDLVTQWQRTYADLLGQLGELRVALDEETRKRAELGRRLTTAEHRVDYLESLLVHHGIEFTAPHEGES